MIDCKTGDLITNIRVLMGSEFNLIWSRLTLCNLDANSSVFSDEEKGEQQALLDANKKREKSIKKMKRLQGCLKRRKGILKDRLNIPISIRHQRC